MVVRTWKSSGYYCEYYDATQQEMIRFMRIIFFFFFCGRYLNTFLELGLYFSAATFFDAYKYSWFESVKQINVTSNQTSPTKNINNHETNIKEMSIALRV